MPRRQGAAGAAAAVVLFGLGLAPGAGAAASPPLIFGEEGLRTDDRQLDLPQWNRVLAAVLAETPTYETCAFEGRCPDEATREWLEALAALADAPPRRRIEAVNDLVNRRPYRSDETNYGRRDHWASPLEFLARSGDCEDYAIAKYVSLRRLGFPPDQLRLVVVHDAVRDIAHAVLLARDADEWLVLDNLRDQAEPQERVVRYQPYYALNEQARWAYALPQTLASWRSWGAAGGAATPPGSPPSRD